MNRYYHQIQFHLVIHHCFALAGQSTAEEMKMWKAQAAEDYKLFLQHRSNELKKG